MKRYALPVLLGLLVGVLVNTGVAWSCSLWSPLGRSTIKTDKLPAGAPTLDGRSLERGERHERFSEVARGVGCEYRQTRDQSVYADMVTSHTPNLMVDAGWPLRTWRSQSSQEKGYAGQRWSPGFADGVAFRTRSPGGPASIRRGVPLRPRLLPLLGMSLPFAAVSVGFVGLRRWRRVVRGRCVECGYDARGLAGCPECGAARTTTAAFATTSV